MGTGPEGAKKLCCCGGGGWNVTELGVKSCWLPALIGPAATEDGDDVGGPFMLGGGFQVILLLPPLVSPPLSTEMSGAPAEGRVFCCCGCGCWGAKLLTPNWGRFGG